VKRLDTSPGDGEDQTIDITDICAQLSTGDGVEPPVCGGLGIDVSGEGFIGRATQADGSLPDDFPSTPTF
jgi:hypothetical protein